MSRLSGTPPIKSLSGMSLTELNCKDATQKSIHPHARGPPNSDKKQSMHNEPLIN